VNSYDYALGPNKWASAHPPLRGGEDGSHGTPLGNPSPEFGPDAHTKEKKNFVVVFCRLQVLDRSVSIEWRHEGEMKLRVERVASYGEGTTLEGARETGLIDIGSWKKYRALGVFRNKSLKRKFRRLGGGEEGANPPYRQELLIGKNQGRNRAVPLVQDLAGAMVTPL